MCSGVGGSLSLKDALSKADPAELQRPGLPGGGAQALWPGRPLRRLSVTLHGMWRAVLLVQQSCPARDVCERLPEVFLNTMRPHFLVFFS